MNPVLIALPFGLAIGISLGLVGGGGSILAVPVLVYVLGEPVREATTASLLVVGAVALVGALDHAREGRVRWRTALGFGAAATAGALLGTALNRVAPPDAILFLFALLLLAAAFGMLRRGEPSAAEEAGPPTLRSRLKLGLAGLGVGALTGFFGVGGGFLVVPALVLLLGLPTVAAIGTSLLVIALTSGAAFAAHLTSGSLNWPVAAALGGAGIVGALAGSRLSGRLPTRRLRQGFAALVLAVGLFLLVDSAAPLVLG
jgi:uncharacterized protein